MLKRLEETIHRESQRGRPIPKEGSAKRHPAILSTIRKAGLPVPLEVSGIEGLLRDSGVI
jgi:hypothetical protein